MSTIKLPLEATYRVGVGFIDMKYYEVDCEDIARILLKEFKTQQKETSSTLLVEAECCYG